MGRIMLGDAVRGQWVQFWGGPSGYVVGNAATDGRGQCIAVPGAKRKRQPISDYPRTRTIMPTVLPPAT
jgi:hypothetical protein